MTSIGTIITTVNAVTRTRKRFVSPLPRWIILRRLGQCAVDRYRVSATPDVPDPDDDGEHDDEVTRCAFMVGGWDCFIALDGRGLVVYTFPRGLADNLAMVYEAVGGVL